MFITRRMGNLGYFFVRFWAAHFAFTVAAEDGTGQEILAGGGVALRKHFASSGHFAIASDSGR